MSTLIGASFNGKICDDTAAGGRLDDRGLHYGDGLFETMLVHQSAVVELERHFERLLTGCRRLEIEAQALSQIAFDIDRLVSGHQSGILKLIMTREAGGRGYRGPRSSTGNCLLLLYDYVPLPGPETTIVRWCTTRMARNTSLAGIKHLNRLEQVLAQREWWDSSIGEGLMLDTEGELISGTSSNVFLVANGSLCTPDLRYCGVRGTMRARVLDKARELHFDIVEAALWPEDIEAASEVFVTNAVRGIRPVVALENKQWVTGPITRKLIDSLDLCR